MNGLLAQAILAVLILPGTVAFLVPWWLLARGGSRSSLHASGLIPFAVGVVLLLECAREFYAAGRGTLAPWAPPRELVVTGLYRFSRNPMYLAALLMLSGWAVGFRSWPLAAYAVAVMIGFHLRVVLHEEPWLAGKHGDKWLRYQARVPRWFGLHRNFGRSDE
jgi:protein-S-isoprenylcysteine O-methyltransferase Ste14